MTRPRRGFDERRKAGRCLDCGQFITTVEGWKEICAARRPPVRWSLEPDERGRITIDRDHEKPIYRRHRR
jgi:hypothetical protein